MSRRRAVTLALAVAGAVGGPARSAAGQDPDVSEGVRLYLEEGNARASRALLARALEGDLAREDALRGWVYLSLAQLALVEDSAASASAHQAQRIEPCVVPSSELAPPSLRAVYRRNRPRTSRCNAGAVSTTALSAVVPGLGMLSLGRAEGLLHAASVVGAGALTLQLAGKADEQYAAYQLTIEPDRAANLYDSSVRYRWAAVGAGVLTAGLHAWGVHRTWQAARAHEARIRPFADYASGPAMNPELRLGLRVDW